MKAGRAAVDFVTPGLPVRILEHASELTAPPKHCWFSIPSGGLEHALSFPLLSKLRGSYCNPSSRHIGRPCTAAVYTVYGGHVIFPCSVSQWGHDKLPPRTRCDGNLATYVRGSQQFRHVSCASFIREQLSSADPSFASLRFLFYRCPKVFQLSDPSPAALA